MSDPSNGSTPYRVVYSERVRSELAKLIAKSKDRGLESEVTAAAREIERRLRDNPKFGQPLLDLTSVPGQIWIGVVPPLVVRYAIYEEKRLVIVATPIALLPHPGL